LALVERQVALLVQPEQMEINLFFLLLQQQ
jgi:hypothetical protein